MESFAEIVTYRCKNESSFQLVFILEQNLQKMPALVPSYLQPSADMTKYPKRMYGIIRKNGHMQMQE